jgi:hypothetical protein
MKKLNNSKRRALQKIAEKKYRRELESERKKRKVINGSGMVSRLTKPSASSYNKKNVTGLWTDSGLLAGFVNKFRSKERKYGKDK